MIVQYLGISTFFFLLCLIRLRIPHALCASSSWRSRGDTAANIKQFESSQAVLAETAVNAFIQDLPESVKDLTDAQEAVTEEARLLGMSEENAMVSDFL